MSNSPKTPFSRHPCASPPLPVAVFGFRLGPARVPQLTLRDDEDIRRPRSVGWRGTERNEPPAAAGVLGGRRGWGRKKAAGGGNEVQ